METRTLLSPRMLQLYDRAYKLRVAAAALAGEACHLRSGEDCSAPEVIFEANDRDDLASRLYEIARELESSAAGMEDRS